MPDPKPSPHALRVADLPQSGATAFELVPTAREVEQLRADLDLVALRKVRLKGTLIPVGKRDWRLTADLGATVVQPCVATLADVQTRIDVPVERTFLAEFEMPDEPEAEMPQDDTLEPLGPFIDPAQVLAEALALALPLYPRAAGSDPVEMRITAPGVAPLGDADVKPFAALAGLREKLEDPDT